jgi:hypothetical protein
MTVAPVVAAMLDELAKTGLHGTSRARVAERLMCQGLTPELIAKWT